MTFQHRLMGGNAEQHTPYRWEWATAVGRVGQAVTNDDLRKWGYQADTEEAYQLISQTGGVGTWQKIAAEGDIGEAIQLLGTQTKQFIGILDQDQIDLSYNDATREITLAPAMDSIDYLWHGELRSLTVARTIQVPNTSGAGYVILNSSGLLELAGTAPGFDRVLIGYYYWNANQQTFVIKGRETHNATRNTAFHEYNHRLHGMQLVTDVGISYTLSFTANVAVSLSGPIVAFDEDLQHTLTHSDTLTGNGYQHLTNDLVAPVMYIGTGGFYEIDRDANQFRGDAVNKKVFINDATLGTQVEVTNNNYFNSFIIFTNCRDTQIKVIQGRQQFNKLDDARAESLDSLGISLAETVGIFQLTYQYKSGDTANAYGIGLKGVQKLIKVEGLYVGAEVQSANDHATALNRDADNQHPISAITGLEAALAAKAPKYDAVSSTLNLGDSSYFKVAIDANWSPSFTAIPATGSVGWTVKVVTTGTPTITWPEEVEMQTHPTLEASKTHLFMFHTDDGGITILGSALVNYDG